MKHTRQKQEAIERMKMLQLHTNIIKEFEKDGTLNLSENGGYLYWLDSDQKAMVEDFEREYKALVYHVIHNYTEIGEMYSLLYVSKDENEWGFGSIGVKPQYGGLVRTA